MEERFDVWAEKYRPQKISEIVDQKEIIERLNNFVKNENIPHLMFAGPAGVGKTTAAICIAKDLFGDMWKGNYLELNASDERGIDVVRNQIKDFARTKPMGVNFKIICLDEADALTADAQHALRRTMEKFISTTRFILIANYSNRIIEPIQSRCAVFRFKPLREENVIQQLKKISSLENVKIDERGLKAVYELSEGDMRRAINMLQAASTMGDISEDTIYEVQSLARPAVIKEMIAFALSGRFIEARLKLIDILNSGIAGEDIVREVSKLIMDFEIENSKKIRIIEKLGEYEFRLHQGGDPRIQLEAMLAEFAL